MAGTFGGAHFSFLSVPPLGLPENRRFANNEPLKILGLFEIAFGWVVGGDFGKLLDYLLNSLVG